MTVGSTMISKLKRMSVSLRNSRLQVRILSGSLVRLAILADLG